MTDDDLREMWRKAGGKFHGPNIETLTMPERLLLPFLRDLVTTRVEEAFREGYCARETYNDIEVSDVNEKWSQAYTNPDSGSK